MRLHSFQQLSRTLLALASVGLFACDSGLELSVDVKTDFVAGIEFNSVRLNLDGEQVTRVYFERGEFSFGSDFAAGQRISDLEGLEPGRYRVQAELLRADNSLLIEREVAVELTQSLAIAIVISRDCSEAMCPGDGSPGDISCLGGRCVDPECVTGFEEVCPDPECQGPSDCPSIAECAIPICSAGVCFSVGDDVACGIGQYCNPERGCESAGGTMVSEDGGMDAGDADLPDVGPDALPEGCGEPCALEQCRAGILNCEGDTPFCEESGPLPDGTLCRPASGDCDQEETCDGVSLDCPGDAFVALGQACGDGFCDGRGTCDASCTPGESCALDCGTGEIQCTGGAPTCELVTPASAGTLCRAAAGPCDLAEVCDGVSGECPADQPRPIGFECRASAGPCDLAEQCDGTRSACPTDQFRPGTFECRASAGVCDRAETCSGSSAACPTDQFHPGTFECRASAGVCDRAETCSGSSAACPTDRFRAATFECRASAGVCDVAETCSGSGANCPGNTFASMGTTCGAPSSCSALECDGAGSCESVPTCTALEFDGSGDLVTVPGAFQFSSSNWSLEAWIWIDPGLSQHSSVVEVGSTSAVSAGVGRRSSSGQIEYFTDQRNGSCIGIGGSDRPGVTGRWVHFALIRNGGNFQRYLGGTAESSTPGFDVTNSDLVIGGERHCFGSGATFPGFIRDVRLWSRALSSGQISSYASGSDPGLGATGLEGWWPLDDGAGQSVRNLVGALEGTLGANAGSGSDDPTWSASP